MLKNILEYSRIIWNILEYSRIIWNILEYSRIIGKLFPSGTVGTANNKIIHTPEKFLVFCIFLINEGWTVGTWVSTLYS